MILSHERPRAYERSAFQWSIADIPKTITVNGEKLRNPAFNNAIFVVHGMGTQMWVETSATLRLGLDDALDFLFEHTGDQFLSVERESLATPPIQEGYWADYDNFRETFPEVWKSLEPRSQNFYERLWMTSPLSAVRTFSWFLRQQLRLLNPSVIWRISIFAWLIYIPLQIAAASTLLILLFRYPKILSRVLNDVRLYIQPVGTLEKGIVQRIEKRVGDAFLRMIGLNWDFLPLPANEKFKVNGKPFESERVVWVSHSLGTVISYNVLSDLFARAGELQKSGTEQQQKGVRKFRASLRRFVTMGSPLDKIAFLFKDKALRPFPPSRESLLDGEERGDKFRDWWVNFFHVLDPVSGALSNRLICGDKPPINYHISPGRMPGFAHVAYWRDHQTLTYILSRVYGRKVLPLDAPRPQSAQVLTLYSMIGYFIWAGLVLLFINLAMWLAPMAWEYLNSERATPVVQIVKMVLKFFFPVLGG